MPAASGWQWILTLIISFDFFRPPLVKPAQNAFYHDKLLWQAKKPGALDHMQAQTGRLSRHYAKTLAALAGEKQKESIRSPLAALRAACTDNPGWQRLNADPLFARSRRQIIAALAEKFAFPPLLARFLAILAAGRHAVLLPEIAQAYEDLLAGTSEKAEIVCAHLPPPPQEARLRRLAEKLFPAAQIAVKQDASLLGGFVLRGEEKTLDASLAGKLKRFSANQE